MRLPDPEQIRAILLDIEGTTTPASFVYDVLFPYAAQELNRFLHRHIGDPEIHPYLAELKEHRLADANPNLPAWQESSEEEQINSLAAYAHWLIERDSKLTALKGLQGRIWQEGYARGELHGQVYPDVPPALRRWKERHKHVYIYSSGSELAQRLLFQSTEYGDLTALIAGFFDTRVGAKTLPGSYQEIASRIRCAPQQILFASDTPGELEAAQSAGLHSVLSVRGASNVPALLNSPAIRSFDEIFPP